MPNHSLRTLESCPSGDLPATMSLGLGGKITFATCCSGDRSLSFPRRDLPISFVAACR